MKTNTLTRKGIAIVLAAATTLSGSVSAQNAAGPVPADSRGQRTVDVPCCKCVDGTESSINISTGTAPWFVSSNLAPAYTGLAGIISNPHPAWAPATNPLAPAKWVQPSASTTRQDFPNGPTTYTLRIRVPDCTVPQRVRIVGRFWNDDGPATATIVGPAGTRSGTGPIHAPQATFPTSVNEPLDNVNAYTKPGIYELRVQVNNVGGGPTALNFNGTLVKQCSRDLERPRGREQTSAEAAPIETGQLLIRN